MSASDINQLNRIEAAEAMQEAIDERAEDIISKSHIKELEEWATPEEWEAICAAAARRAESEIEDEIEAERAEEAYRRREGRED